MKYFRIAEGLTINPELIFAIGTESNKSQLEEWDNQYSEYVNGIYEYPIELVIDGQPFKPDFNKNIDPSILNKYMETLKEYIINNIGEKPEFRINYFVILSTGNKVYLTHEVYDAIMHYLDDNSEIIENTHELLKE